MTWSGGGAPQARQVLGGVRVADQGDVVAADERAVDRGADAGVGLRARRPPAGRRRLRRAPPPDRCPRRSRRSSCAPAALTSARTSSGTYSHGVALPRQLLVAVLDPDDRALPRRGPGRRACRCWRRRSRARGRRRRRRSGHRSPSAPYGCDQAVWSSGTPLGTGIPAHYPFTLDRPTDIHALPTDRRGTGAPGGAQVTGAQVTRAQGTGAQVTGAQVTGALR